jgi:hypothetical protein
MLKLGNAVPKRLGTARQKTRALSPPTKASHDTDNFEQTHSTCSLSKNCVCDAAQHGSATKYIAALVFPTRRAQLLDKKLAGDAIKSVTDAIRNWCRQDTLITSRTSLTVVCKTRLLLLENTTIREPWLRGVQQSLTLQLGTGLHKI